MKQTLLQSLGAVTAATVATVLTAVVALAAGWVGGDTCATLDIYDI